MNTSTANIVRPQNGWYDTSDRCESALSDTMPTPTQVQTTLPRTRPTADRIRSVPSTIEIQPHVLRLLKTKCASSSKTFESMTARIPWMMFQMPTRPIMSEAKSVQPMADEVAKRSIRSSATCCGIES